EPGPVTTAFDGAAATAFARTIARDFPDRTPGSEDDMAAADFVEENFGQISAGRVHEQRFSADVGGSTRELRNVILVLPGATDESVLVVAGRDSRAGPGATTSAAATGVLLELAAVLGTTER